MANETHLSFEDWLAMYADADNAVRGRKFEELTKRYLLRREPNVESVWMWEEWPDRPGSDMGIDLVVRTRDGELWAIQCKNYTKTVGWGDIATFVGDSSEGFSRRVLFTSRDDVSSNLVKQVARLAVEHYDPAVFSDFDCSEDAAVLPDRIELRPYQREAVSAVSKELLSGKHCTMIMPTGAGKTVVFSRIASNQKFMFAVPSIFLASQSARAFLADDPSRRAIIVCSDDTTGRADEKWAGVPVCKTVDEIASYPGHSVFVTYDSLWKVLAAGRTFDVIFGDEAHRLANSGTKGKEIWDFGTPIVWGTATPKTLSSSLRDKGAEVSSMDDESLFGREVVNVSVRSLIEDGYLSDFRVVVMAVGDSETAKFIAQRGYVQAGKQLMNAEDAAFYIAMEKMRDEYEVNRIVTYHSTISQTREAAKSLRTFGFRSEHIEAKTPDYERRRILRKLETGGIVPNAHTLSEGVDIPTLDAVCFATPKRSKIDIVQSVGRALRLDPANEDKLGYVVLPVVISAESSMERSLEESNFRDVFRVLNYLAEVDDAVRAEIEEIRTGDGARARTVDDKPSRIIVDSRVAGMSREDMAREIKMHIVHSGVREDLWSKSRRCIRDYLSLGGNVFTGGEFARRHGVWLGHMKRWYKDPSYREFPMPEDLSSALMEAIPGWLYNRQEETVAEALAFCETRGYLPKQKSLLGTQVSNARMKKQKWALDLEEKYPTKRQWDIERVLDDSFLYWEGSGEYTSTVKQLRSRAKKGEETESIRYIREKYPELLETSSRYTKPLEGIKALREYYDSHGVWPKQGTYLGNLVNTFRNGKTTNSALETAREELPELFVRKEPPVVRYVDAAARLGKLPRQEDLPGAYTFRHRWRKAYREGTLAQEHIDMLEACEYWTWG